MDEELAREIARCVAEREAAELRAASVLAELRGLVVGAIQSGQLTELGAHRMTGLSRTTVRDWLGKT
jgi:hypothetical protein